MQHFGIRGSLPVVQQTEATECGLACLAMISAYYGHNSISALFVAVTRCPLEELRCKI